MRVGKRSPIPFKTPPETGSREDLDGGGGAFSTATFSLIVNDAFLTSGITNWLDCPMSLIGERCSVGNAATTACCGAKTLAPEFRLSGGTGDFATGAASFFAGSCTFVIVAS